MNIILEVSGGIGKCVIATALCEAIKKQYPDSKLIVVSGYSDVFLNNPNVYRTYNYGLMSYFYEEFIEDKEFIVLKHDPYNETSFLKQKESIIKTWCEMFDITYNGELPKLYLTEREKTFFAQKFHSDKPIFVIQTNGGGNQELKYSWARDIPFEVATKVVEEFKDIYNVVHIKREDQLVLEHTIPISDTFRALAVLISLSRKRLFMDSFAQHTSAALGLQSTVCWVANKPIVFGYEMHDNIVSNPFTINPELRNAYLNKFDIGGNLIEFPYNNESEIFNVDDIIKSIKKQK